MLDWFNYYGHMCLTFEMLGLSVFDFMVRLLYMTSFFRLEFMYYSVYTSVYYSEDISWMYLVWYVWYILIVASFRNMLVTSIIPLFYKWLHWRSIQINYYGVEWSTCYSDVIIAYQEIGISKDYLWLSTVLLILEYSDPRNHSRTQSCLSLSSSMRWQFLFCQ